MGTMPGLAVRTSDWAPPPDKGGTGGARRPTAPAEFAGSASSLGQAGAVLG